MKSCLKVTPPYTPLLDSGFGSPSGSGSTSPNHGCEQLPTLSKRVSFCQDHLEEYFEADDWDRTPAPVAPKLSYQEILELKEIMKSLPRAPTSSYRQPFSSTCIPYNVSPPSQSNPPFPISRFATAPSLTPSKWKNRDDSRSTVDPEILPYLDSVPIRLLPLLPPSQEAPPSSVPESSNTSSTATPASTPRSMSINPPSSIALPHSITPLPSPMPTPQPQTPPRRKPNFTFLPLLPLQEEVKVAAEPVVVSPPTPTRKFNMTFVPLLPPEEPSKLAVQSQPATQPPRIISAPEPAETTPQGEMPPEDYARHDEHEQDFSPPPTYVPLNFHRSYTSTPSLCSASDTDTESEAPSVSSPCPSSPAESELSRPHHCDSRLGVVSHADAYDNATSNHNPYFPTMPVSNIPSHVIADSLAAKTVHLHALPSPALQPPSPFTLSPSDAEFATANVDATPMTKRAFTPRSSSLSSATQGQDVLDAVCESLNTLGVTRTPTRESPAPDTPELTIEYLRARSHARGPSGDNILEPSIRRREL